MTEQPVVSVVLPVRNAASTIDEALGSVLVQTFCDFEVIAVEDGSTDGTGQKLRMVAERDPRVRVISGSEQGTTAALIQGISLARGRYLARQDADDLSMPERFARQVAFLEAHPDVCAVGTAAVAIDDGAREVGRFPTRHGPSAVRDGMRAGLITPVHGSVMIRRECLDAVGGYRPAFLMSQDFDLWTRLLERWDIDNLEDVLYRWRLTRTSTYGDHRLTQLMYGGIGLAFAAERRKHGSDSYALLARCDGDLEQFADSYRMRGLLRAIWGDLLLRGTGDAHLSRRHFARALRHGHVDPRTLLLWGWTSMGLPWIGGKPFRVPAAGPRASGSEP